MILEDVFIKTGMHWTDDGRVIQISGGFHRKNHWTLLHRSEKASANQQMLIQKAKHTWFVFEKRCSVDDVWLKNGWEEGERGKYGERVWVKRLDFVYVHGLLEWITWLCAKQRGVYNQFIFGMKRMTISRKMSSKVSVWGVNDRWRNLKYLSMNYEFYEYLSTSFVYKLISNFYWVKWRL